ncbi:MAG: gamma carbonic anhydrase family protein [Planctomycetes bacterium]|nr:gamma carbonic anhydrase family protein [Planctomycetota bacterium]
MTESAPRPTIGQNVFIAATAYVCGDVTLGDDCSVWHHVTIRGDVSPIRIGRRVNVQDGSVIHTQHDVPLEIGDDVTIGHRAVVHNRRVGNRALIGIGAILLDGSEIGAGSLVAAGCVVPPGMIIPAGKLVVGTPARIVRNVREQEHAYMAFVVENYPKLAQRHAAGLYPAHSV